jgi:hypothetical protein
VSPEDAIKVALELKKDLVDQGLLSLTQADLEKHLFRIMEVKGYGHIYRERFTMTLKYHLTHCSLSHVCCKALIVDCAMIYVV